MPNGKQAEIKHVGSMKLQPGLILRDVLHILDFQFNVLSISKLTRQYSANVVFTLNACLLQGHTWEKVLTLGKENKGL